MISPLPILNNSKLKNKKVKPSSGPPTPTFFFFTLVLVCCDFLDFILSSSDVLYCVKGWFK